MIEANEKILNISICNDKSSSNTFVAILLPYYFQKQQFFSLQNGLTNFLRTNNWQVFQIWIQ